MVFCSCRSLRTHSHYVHWYFGHFVSASPGYDHVTPTTDPGRIFTVFFGLLGIPLMFITAADIGKFLSEIVIRSYGQLLNLWLWVAKTVDGIKDQLFRSDSDSLDSV